LLHRIAQRDAEHEMGPQLFEPLHAMSTTPASHDWTPRMHDP
jgi:hypothetical protein